MTISSFPHLSETRLWDLVLGWPLFGLMSVEHAVRSHTDASLWGPTYSICKRSYDSKARRLSTRNTLYAELRVCSDSLDLWHEGKQALRNDSSGMQGWISRRSCQLNRKYERRSNCHENKSHLNIMRCILVIIRCSMEKPKYYYSTFFVINILLDQVT